MANALEALVAKEGWELVRRGEEIKILAYGTEYPLRHPFQIHAKLYRESRNPETKYLHMKAMHDYLWPTTLWHYWTEDRFKAHCEGWKYISQAGGASTTKSYDTAKIAILFWLGNPEGRAVIIASTTLDSLNQRIWGYATRLLSKAAVPIGYNFLQSTPPKILNKSAAKNAKDTIHGMFAVAAKQGDDERAISSWIGRHPDEGIMVILDEATDMPPALLKALPNLERGVENFQCLAIGNSKDKFDLHGAMSTPLAGWDSIDPLKDSRWETTQKNGICLFFSCYNSPAIFEADPVRKKALGKFLITEEQILDKKRTEGENSEAFWRFTLGFWKSESTSGTVIDRKFIDAYDVRKKAEWSGQYPLSIVAGLDPAFSTGGDSCVLRLGILGHTVDGQIVLDYRGEELLFRLAISATVQKSAELQIAEKTLEILAKYGCPVENLCIDANGQGRALGEVIHLKNGGLKPPVKIYSVRTGNKQVNSFDVTVRTTHEMWFSFRQFIVSGQIKGMDEGAIGQLTTRKIVMLNGKERLESKHDYKNRMGAVNPILAHSPDEADAASLCLQSAIINYGFTPGQKREVVREVSFTSEKYWVFQQNAEKQARADMGTMSAAPVATFGKGLEEVISAGTGGAFVSGRGRGG